MCYCKVLQNSQESQAYLYLFKTKARIFSGRWLMHSRVINYYSMILEIILTHAVIGDCISFVLMFDNFFTVLLLYDIVRFSMGWIHTVDKFITFVANRHIVYLLQIHNWYPVNVLLVLYSNKWFLGWCHFWRRCWVFERNQNIHGNN